MTLESDISELKEAFREYIKIKIHEEAERRINEFDGDMWKAELDIENGKYKSVLYALDGRKS